MDPPEATNLDGPTGGHAQVFRKNITSGAIQKVSLNNNQNPIDSPASHPSFGETVDDVLFDTKATNLSSSGRQVYRRDVSNQKTTSLTEGDSPSFGPSYGKDDVFFKTRDTGEADLDSLLDIPTQIVRYNGNDPVLMSSDQRGRPSFRRCVRYSVPFDSDQHDIAYATESGHVSGLDTPQQIVAASDDVHARLVSTTTDGVSGLGPSFAPALSKNGSHVIYESDAENLIPSDTNNERDVFFGEQWKQLKQPPVVVVSSPDIVRGLDTWVRFDASKSFDPKNRQNELSYRWSITQKPSSGHVDVKGSQTSIFYLRTDVEGVFTISLDVENIRGETTTTTETVTVKNPFRRVSLNASSDADVRPSRVVAERSSTLIATSSTFSIQNVPAEAGFVSSSSLEAGPTRQKEAPASFSPSSTLSAFVKKGDVSLSSKAVSSSSPSHIHGSQTSLPSASTVQTPLEGTSHLLTASYLTTLKDFGYTTLQSTSSLHAESTKNEQYGTFSTDSLASAQITSQSIHQGSSQMNASTSTSVRPSIF
jgi:hypothetical protein